MTQCILACDTFDFNFWSLLSWEVNGFCICHNVIIYIFVSIVLALNYSFQSILRKWPKPITHKYCCFRELNPSLVECNIQHQFPLKSELIFNLKLTRFNCHNKFLDYYLTFQSTERERVSGSLSLN